MNLAAARSVDCREAAAGLCCWAKLMSVDPKDLTNTELDNLIANHRRHGQTERKLYIEALEERARRRGKGLEFKKSFELIRRAAHAGKFLSYKELADESGANWTQVHYSIGTHLWDLVEYAHRRGWPMLSAIVVNKQNVATGGMEAATLQGFIGAAKDLGYNIDDEQAFLREQQEKVFAWAQGTDDSQIDAEELRQPD